MSRECVVCGAPATCRAKIADGMKGRMLCDFHGGQARKAGYPVAKNRAEERKASSK